MAGRNFNAFKVITKNKVHNTRNCVGTVGRRCTFLEYFNALKCRHWNRCSIDKNGAIICNACRNGLTLAIDQHQGRGKTQAAKVYVRGSLSRTRCKAIGVVFSTGAYRQLLSQFANGQGALLLNVVAVQNLDRRGLVCTRALDVRTCNHDLFEVAVVVLCQGSAG